MEQNSLAEHGVLEASVFARISVFSLVFPFDLITNVKNIGLGETETPVLEGTTKPRAHEDPEEKSSNSTGD